MSEQQPQGWQPIATARKWESVLCAWPSGKGYVFGVATWAVNDSDDGWFDEDGGHWLDDDGRECNPPTHWMKIPEPPK